MLDKASLRIEYKSRLRALSPADRARESEELGGRLEAWANAEGFEVLLATLPLANEPDLTSFLKKWLEGGRALALARTGEAGAMAFHYVESLNGPWQRHGSLLEPPQERPAWRAGPRTACLVPGLAFSWDEGAWRLGRGGGYFDRWLTTHHAGVFSLGVGFSASVCEALPHDPWDQKLDGLALAGQALRISASLGASRRRR